MPCDKSKVVKEAIIFTQDEFKKMTKTEQVCHLLKQGEEMLSRDESDHSITLYLLSGFFVEVWYEPPNSKIDRIELISPKMVMKKYEKKIEIENML
jgi:hypothetical protein